MSERDVDLLGFDGFVCGLVVSGVLFTLFDWPGNVIAAVAAVLGALTVVTVRELARRRNP